MKLSVIIPAYNSEMFLAETLDCLVGQTLDGIQIIIVNDGSTDSTPDIIAEYAARHKTTTNTPITIFLSMMLDLSEMQYIIC